MRLWACRDDLLEALPTSDLQDMQAAVLEALNHVTGNCIR